MSFTPRNSVERSTNRRSCHLRSALCERFAAPPCPPPRTSSLPRGHFTDLIEVLGRAAERDSS
eukprot:4171426-Prymnesium_polylepis.1